MPNDIWDEIDYSFPNFKDSAHVIITPSTWFDLSQAMLVKGSCFRQWAGAILFQIMPVTCSAPVLSYCQEVW